MKRTRSWVAALVLAGVLAGSAFAEPRTLVINGDSAELVFSCDAVGMLPVEGRFTKFAANITIDEAAPENATAQVVIDARSIDAPSAWIDVLKGPDFFDVERYPEISFHSTRTEVEEPGRIKVTGNLTVRNVTRPVTLHVSYDTDTTKLLAAKAKIEVDTELNRAEFGMTAYDLMLSDEVDVAVDGTLARDATPPSMQ